MFLSLLDGEFRHDQVVTVGCSFFKITIHQAQINLYYMGMQFLRKCPRCSGCLLSSSSLKLVNLYCDFKSEYKSSQSTITKSTKSDVLMVIM